MLPCPRFKSGNPEKRAKAIVNSVSHPYDFDLICKESEDLGEPIVGINCDEIRVKMEERGI